MGWFNNYTLRKSVEAGIKCQELWKHKSNTSYQKHLHGVSGFVLGSVFNVMIDEQKEINKRYDRMLNQASQNAELSGPRRFEVHQPWDPIIHEDIW